MIVKDPMGLGVMQTAMLDAITGTPTIIAAPGGGLLIAVWSYTITATGTFIFESPALTNVYRAVPAGGRPIMVGMGPKPVILCGENAILRLNSASSLNGQLMFSIIPS